MSKALGFDISKDLNVDFQTGKSRVFLIEAFRLMFLVSIFLIFLGFQIRESYFISLELVVPVYGLLFIAFALNTVYLFSFEKWPNILPLFTAFLFAFDNIFITSIVFTTGSAQSIFLFLYLVNIILCGLIFKRRGAVTLALMSSTSFSILMILNPEVEGTQLYFSMGVNNLAFIAVALLSGYLSEQIGFMGEKIEAQEKDIRVLQDLNKLIVESMPSGLITFDSNGYIVHCNIAAQKILSDELKGREVNEFFDGLMGNIKDALYLEHGRYRGEVVFVNRNEERLVLGLTASPLLTSEGESFGHILLFQDLTQIKRLENQARRNEKMAAIGQLAAGIAHEIRNPLASISGSIQLLQGTDPSSEENQKLFQIVLKEIDRLNILITEFLDFARPEKTPSDSVDLNTLLKEVLSMAKVDTKLPQHVKQVIRLNARSKILGQHDKLKQVFLNLVINAYQAMDNTKEATLTVETTDREGLVHVVVRDTGPGMKPNIKNRIFEPFLTTKNKGTGLGLATVHKILENHGARITVESELGQGAEFIIEFNRLLDTEPGSDNVIDIHQRRSHG